MFSSTSKNLQTINLDDFARLVNDKKGLYCALKYQAQLYLPNSEMCTLEFMSKLLSGKKKAFQMFEICLVSVPTRVKKFLTIDLLMSKLEDNFTIMSYLPDDARTHINKEYLYTIVNTLDANFFPTVEREIEAKM